ncbi:MAG: DUF3299 domain-containing protein [Rhizobiaceae bacterium]
MKKIASSAAIVLAVIAAGGAFVAYQTLNQPTTLVAEAQAAKKAPDLTNPKVIGWEDLLPEGDEMFVPPDAASDFPNVQSSPFPSPETGGVGVMSGAFNPNPVTPIPASARQDLANQFVKIAGYMTPLAVEQGKTRTFLLVPYVGACIHVPAPPANQIVLVETKEPIEVRPMWEPFEAIGTLSVESISTGLADVSYTMDLNRIEPYVDDLDTEGESN